jgi:hypothetical protein
MPVPDRLWRRSRDATSGAGDPPAPVADEVLVRRVADGDTAALAALYSRYRVGLFGFLQRYAGDRMLAEEILQDTLLAVWRSAHAYAGRSSVRTWRVLTVGIPRLTGGWLAAAMREVWATSPRHCRGDARAAGRGRGAEPSPPASRRLAGPAAVVSR